MSASELTDVVGEDASVDAVESEILRLEPGGEGAKICAVRAPSCHGEAAVLEEAVDRSIRVHRDVFASAPRAPPEMRPVRGGHLRGAGNRRTLSV